MTLARTCLLVALAASLSAPAANAHFKLNSPGSMSVQGSLGDPQMSSPCGFDSGSLEETNVVTDVMTGSTLSISLTETIGHPGHFRVALAVNEGALPADPPITPVGNDECGSTVIDENPVLPVLGDGLLAHNSML